MQNEELRARIHQQGFALCEGVLDENQIAALCEMESDGTAKDEISSRRRSGALYARRNMLDIAAVRTIARSGVVRSLVEPVLGPNCFAVRGILFDKTPEANWKVVWHQDFTIAVQQKREAPGFGPWSEKAGVTHVQPPMEILERMLAVRLHLDDCGMENGPLRVLPGSHRTGRLSATDIAAWRERTPETICAALRGSALLMQPLLLHASSAAGVAAHRRVLHLEWAAEELPHGLCWQNEVR
jgi:ectoine hydroxylase-related dioxygenase (phytanoyl-CoA dioxygenase family)